MATIKVKEVAKISNPEDKKKIRDALSEISDSMYRIEAERDNIKAIVDMVADKYEIPKPIINKMAKCFHKESFDEEAKKSDDFNYYYESIVRCTED